MSVTFAFLSAYPLKSVAAFNQPLTPLLADVDLEMIQS